ncbi:membrane protein [Lysinibacillus alkalisoli]|uniref:Membrane protein n=1 Tax=Lysinibacillus alkalisoli TaxID=1911548 RepID=A0A917G0F0_9BACI|nr:DUF485 domain-containing protein [Lysinibacillus alkalisoli]GGG16456.1 membrane protein [Lysinibacillus alkalisoli]
MANQGNNTKVDVVDYDAIAALPSFKALVKRKNGFLWTVTAIFLIAYITLPILTSYTTILHQKVWGDITGVWIYSAGLFIMTWGLCHLYVARANTYDKAAAAIIEEYKQGGGRL